MAKKKIEKDLTATLTEMDVVKTTKKKTTAKKNNKEYASGSNKDVVDVKIKLLEDMYMSEEVKPTLPQYAHIGDIGMDVIATAVEYDHEYDYFIYHTGISAETIEGVACFLMPRSSVSDTSGYLCNGVGLVDPFTYRGEICFRFKNRTALSTMMMLESLWVWHNKLNWWERLWTKFEDVFDQVSDEFCENIYSIAPYQVGDKIGQLVFVKVPEVNVVQVDELTETERGEGGFGSTGK